MIQNNILRGKTQTHTHTHPFPWWLLRTPQPWQQVWLHRTPLCGHFYPVPDDQTSQHIKKPTLATLLPSSTKSVCSNKNYQLCDNSKHMMFFELPSFVKYLRNHLFKPFLQKSAERKLGTFFQKSKRSQLQLPFFFAFSPLAFSNAQALQFLPNRRFPRTLLGTRGTWAPWRVSSTPRSSEPPWPAISTGSGQVSGF